MAYDSDDGSQGEEAKAKTRSLRDVLAEYEGRVNPRPLEHWGSPEDPSFSMLCDAFRGRTNIVMKKRNEEYRDQYGKKKVKVVEYNCLTNVCAKHAQIAAAPGKYAFACDECGRTVPRHTPVFNLYGILLWRSFVCECMVSDQRS